MNRKELLIIGIGLGFTIPMIIFVIFWWSISVMNTYNIIQVTESFIVIFSIIGLFIGILADILYLRKLIPLFYRIKMSLLIATYMLCSVMAIAFFMGLPIGNLILGIIAGIYIGRRYHHNNQSRDEFTPVLKAVTIFTASVTTLGALSIGFLALQEKSLIGSINQYFGFKIFFINNFIDTTIIVSLCIILFIIQYISTKISSKYMFNINK